ncbi:hypothetical protein Clacol_002349 [Clathrus columnatus]|uniref:Uncharacterized protein n=1 Tax=Clathrus columnatus TaxID=1419009 RepID=A0AAV5A542_9AGAM|nr:hypothetical protein Clacol_002349 [Clathrus columnatus]
MNIPLTDEIITRVNVSLDGGGTTQSLSPQELNATDSNVFQPSHITNVNENMNKTTIANPTSSNLENSYHNYPSSPRMSRMSMASAFSQISSSSQDSSSSWYSARTVISSNDRSITPATTVSFSHTQPGSYNKHDSIDQLSFTNYSRPLSFNPPLSPPLCALSPLPSDSADVLRPDSPIHSLISEYSDTFGENSQLPSQIQKHVPTQHSDHHTTPPPRPPRNPNRSRSLSPELSLNTKLSHTGPPSPSQQHNSPASSGPGVPISSRSHFQSYAASYPSSSLQSHVHVHFPHYYSAHSNLSHVKEEEEEEGQNFLQSETGSGGGGRERRDHRFEDTDVRSDYTDDHEYEFDGRQSDGITGSGDNTDDGERNSRSFYLAEHYESVGDGGPIRSVWSPYTSFLPSIYTGVSSEGPVSTSRSPTIKNKWIESTTLAQRARSHLSRLKKWKKRAITTVIENSSSKRGKEGAQIGTVERTIVIGMISDALEMARSCYSVRVHKLGYELGKDVQHWLQIFADNDPSVLNDRENITLLTTVQTCFLPILLIRIAKIEPSAATLANNLIVALTKAPISLHEDESSVSPLFTSLPSNHSMAQPIPSSPHIHSIPVIPQRTTSISSIAIHMVAQELGSPTPICPTQHSWLGITLLKIVEMTVKLRLLSFGEIEDITMVGWKREGEYTPQSDSKKSSSSPVINAPAVRPWEVALFGRKREGEQFDSKSPSLLIDAPITRPWEVALFALCASTETSSAPFFKRMVLGPMGIPLFIRSLNSLMASHIDMGDVKWEDVGLTLRALAFVSKHEWVVRGMSGDDNSKAEELIKSIMKVFWRSIPERWFSIRFWAMDTVRNIVSHQNTLIRLLAEMEADKAFLTLTPSSPLYPSTINTTRTSAEGDGKTRNRLLEEYRKESAKRAEEMVEYIKKRSGGARNRDDSSSKRGSKDTAVLQPVAIGFDGR